jgi:hypothetical protein
MIHSSVKFIKGWESDQGKSNYRYIWLNANEYKTLHSLDIPFNFFFFFFERLCVNLVIHVRLSVPYRSL